jgi:hypothetical protein
MGTGWLDMVCISNKYSIVKTEKIFMNSYIYLIMSKKSTDQQLIAEILAIVKDLQSRMTAVEASMVESKVDGGKRDIAILEVTNKIDKLQISGGVAAKKGKKTTKTGPLESGKKVPPHLKSKNMYTRHIFTQCYNNDKKFDDPLFSEIKEDLVKKVAEIEAKPNMKNKKTPKSRISGMWGEIWKTFGPRLDAPTTSGRKTVTAYREEALEAWKADQSKETDAVKTDEKEN